VNIAREQPSTYLGPVTGKKPYRFHDGVLGFECDVGEYQVCVRWDWGAAKLADGTYALLQVCRADGGSVFDWRHLQQIKNAVCGPEWEAVEVFPAESRLKDPSNARYLWASKDQLPFGLPGGRVVLNSTEAFAPQRPFEKHGAPQ